jgi:hypothetical protein
VHAPVLQDVHGVEGRVRLPYRGQDFAGRLQDVHAIDVAGGQHVHEAFQVGLGLVDALLDEGIGHGQIQSQRLVLLVQLLELGGHVLQRPAEFLTLGDMVIHAGRAGFLVFEQPVGDVGVGRYHENAVVQLLALAAVEDDVIENIGEGGHRGAADFFNCS